MVGDYDGACCLVTVTRKCRALHPDTGAVYLFTCTLVFWLKSLIVQYFAKYNYFLSELNKKDITCSSGRFRGVSINSVGQSQTSRLPLYAKLS